MAKPERDLIFKRLSSLAENERMFRINAGMGWTAAAPDTVIKRDCMGRTTVVMRNARPFHGAPTGFPDLVGWETVTVTPEMVGEKIAVFVGEEVKATGGLKPAQARFRDVLTAMGGVHRTIKS
jgi:hypothetical protein